MSTIEFNIRDLKTGEVVCAEFPDLATAEAWLIERPPFMQVLRLVTTLEPATEARLRDAMRALDEGERAIMIEAEQAAAAERMAEIARLQKAKDDAPKDPHRLMTLHWDLANGLTMVDPADDRELTSTAHEAVLAWVAERDTWVEDRGERVVAANISVWPGPIPGGNEDNRIPPGSKFVTGSRTPDA